MFVQILKSDRDGKKLKAIFYNKDMKKVKTTNFGATGYEDYTIHKDPVRRRRYINRHKKENWNDYMSAGSLSRYILWEYKSLDKAKREYAKRFNLKLI